MEDSQLSDNGSLVCVGTGMMLGAHITPRARHYIETADVVFVAASDGLVEKWVEGMNSDVRSLQDFYSEGKSRLTTYKEMVQVILNEVRAGKKVCGAFYGHPGVFALVPHKAIQSAKSEGFEASLEPGISAEDCLIADLGVDPGKYGCQQYEATQFMFYRRIIDPSAYLILWQIGMAGDLKHGISVTGPAYRNILLELLYENYPAEHEVILYEAPTTPLKQVRMDKIQLKDLVNSTVYDFTTLVIPPAREMKENTEIINKIRNS